MPPSSARPQQNPGRGDGDGGVSTGHEHVGALPGGKNKSSLPATYRAFHCRLSQIPQNRQANRSRSNRSWKTREASKLLPRGSSKAQNQQGDRDYSHEIRQAHDPPCDDFDPISKRRNRTNHRNLSVRVALATRLAILEVEHPGQPNRESRDQDHAVENGKPTTMFHLGWPILDRLNQTRQLLNDGSEFVNHSGKLDFKAQGTFGSRTRRSSNALVGGE